MKERMFGMETEYGVTLVPKNEAEFDPDSVTLELVSLARRYPHLPGLHSKGIFLANGSRFYIDCGAHPELATPECANPWDICRYIQAGEQMLLVLAGQLPARVPGVERAVLLRNNTDYATKATWGCHESYLHADMDRDALSRQLIPFLVSRQIFSGSGGFDCHSPGINFLVSPRVAHLRAAVSGDSTRSRGIFHTRDEPLCGNGYQRLHILCGESLCGETGTWLKIGTTALIVALIEAGKRPGNEIDLPDPLVAMRTFAGDPSCTKSVRLANGRKVTALDIQEHYLRQAETHADAQFMPPWTGEVCRRWRRILERLRDGGPAAVATTLDWAIKYALFQSHLRRRDMTFEKLADWTGVLEQLHAAEITDSDAPVTAESLLGSNDALAAAKKQLGPLVQQRGLAWKDLEAFLALRLELFEIDTRYSILGEGGIFSALDRGGVLDHRFTGVDNIPHALANPPAIGRAALRGTCIRRVAGQNGRFASEWDGVFDTQANCWLNLTDPFATSEQWEKMEIRRESHSPSMEELFRAGYYSVVISNFPPASSALSVNTIECIVLSYARTGRVAESLQLLDVYRQQLEPFHLLSLTMSILSNGLVPDAAEMAPLVAEGGPMLEQSGESDSYARYIFLIYKGLFLLHKGRLPLAEEIFTALLNDGSCAYRPRMFSRTRCYSAELNRRYGRDAAALQLARAALETHRDLHLRGDAADHSLPMMGKLTANDEEAAEFLADAVDTQRQLRNHLGLARMLCIRARRLRFDGDRQEVELLHRTVPVLKECAVARKIVREWRSWVEPKPGSGPLDYWGL